MLAATWRYCADDPLRHPVNAASILAPTSGVKELNAREKSDGGGVDVGLEGGLIWLLPCHDDCCGSATSRFVVPLAPVLNRPQPLS